MSSLTKRQIVENGLASLDRKYHELIKCLREMFASSPSPQLAEALPSQSGESLQISHLNPADAAQVASIAFQLLDMVEERVAEEARHKRIEVFDDAGEEGLWAHCFASLKHEGITEEKIVEAFKQTRIEPVFTAHPTEAKRPSVRQRHRDIYLLLRELENDSLSRNERKTVREDFIAALEALWHTGEIHVEKPTIERELRNALYYLREVFPNCLETVFKNLELAWEDAGFDVANLKDAGPKSRFGLWIGGDRDGHPFVTADVTRNTLAELHDQAMKLYRNELANIASHLSLMVEPDHVPPTLQGRIDSLVDELGPQGEEIVGLNAGEPWRALSYLLRSKLTSDSPPNKAEFTADVELLGATLREAGAKRLDEGFIQPLLHKLGIFGFHLANLDIRQNSAFHDKAAAQMLESAGVADGAAFADWPEAKRLEFLSSELESKRPLLHWDHSVGPEADAVRDCYRIFVDHRRKSREGLGSLIISMTRQLSDMLLVHLFAREAGLTEDHHGHLVCPLQVVPLFETLDDLHNAPGIVDSYLSHPVAKRSLEISSMDSPTPTQQVMLGYSDSNKDGGIVASQWALHQAQQAVTDVAKKHGFHVRFFHGRGGTISRGAGPTNWFLRALPHGSLQGDFRMTEQGETIAKKYAYPDNAIYHCETLAACITRSTVLHREERTKDDPGKDVIPQLAEWSRDAYRALLEMEDFMTFYRQATPIDALERTQLGSRPSRRTGTATLDDLRAIPWVFSWTQSRFYIPGWFGVGTALDRLAQDADRFQRFSEAIPKSTLPRYIFTGVETNLLSADFTLMRKYASLVQDESIRTRFMDRIEDELTLAKKHLARLFPESVDKRRLRYTKTLQLREAPLKGLHEQQVELLRTWRESGGDLPKELVLSIGAVASGLRTTG